MNLDEVSRVTVDHKYGHKFIVARLTDGSGRERIVVRARNEDFKYHVDILSLLKREVATGGINVQCVGGGG